MATLGIIILGLVVFIVFKKPFVSPKKELAVPSPSSGADMGDTPIRPGQFHGNALDMKTSCVLNDVDLLDFVTSSPKECSISSRLAIGLDAKFTFRESHEKKTRRFSLKADSLTKREILDEIIRYNTDYYWIEKDGVINIQPLESPGGISTSSPLDMTIPEFEVHKIPAELALEYLTRIAIEHNIPVTTFMREMALRKGFPVPDSGKLKHPEYVSPEELIDVVIPQQVSIRRCLNAIVLANPPAYWWATKYHEKTALGLASFKSYSDVPVPKHFQGAPFKFSDTEETTH